MRNMRKRLTDDFFDIRRISDKINDKLKKITKLKLKKKSSFSKIFNAKDVV